MTDITRNTVPLSAVPVGVVAVVSEVVGSGIISRRLMEMGIVPGVRVRVVKYAPFGDPIELRVRGFNLAIRRSEASQVTVLIEVGEEGQS
ncbi:MAG: FeoA family protein [Pyrinomonadaceae bacterium]